MPIAPDDIRLFRSERMTDFADGGGRMSPTVIQDGQDNNVFDDITDLERVAGRVSIRKVFGQVLSLDQDTLLSAYALLDDAPDDPATDACIFAFGGLTDERAAAISALEQTWGLPSEYPSVRVQSGGGYSVRIEAPGPAVPASVFVGQTIALLKDSVAPVLVRARIVSLGTLGRQMNQTGDLFDFLDVTVDRPVPTLTGAMYTGGHRAYLGVPLIEPVKTYGCMLVAAGAAAGASSISIDSAVARVVPWGGATYPETSEGINPLPFAAVNGDVPIVRAADAALLHHTAALAPQAVSNAQTVNVGRANLARLRVVGSDGTVHARFDANSPAPTGVGCTADLAAGTVTFQDVSGLAQPVTIEHRIEELLGVASISGTTLTLSRSVSRDYPAGAKVSSLLRLGDLRGRVVGGFAQQAWTGVWDDARVGGEPTADFQDVQSPITVTNKGAVEERWAVVFTNTTSFRVIGEFLGEVGNGSTGSPFAPINPATGEPFFTIPAAGWGTGWSAGNVWRFNTRGANAPLWLLRSVAPSLPGGSDSVAVEFRGFVNV